MKNKIALTLIALVSFSGLAMAESHKGGHKNHYDHIGQQLNLTDEQRAQMQTLHQSIKTENQEARLAHQAEMEKFFNNPTFDENKAKELIEKNKDQNSMRKMKYRHAMYQILTPDQRAQHSQLMQNNGRNKKDQTKHKHHNQ